jgi:hypothetical protein
MMGIGTYSRNMVMGLRSHFARGDDGGKIQLRASRQYYNKRKVKNRIKGK